MDEHTLQLFFLVAGFWVALLGYAALGGSARWSRRWTAGLALGAALAHVAWLLMHPGVVLAQPAALLDPTAGATVLAVPLGILLTAPRTASPGARARYLQVALGSLPLALATARLGCLAAGCCHGLATRLPWGLRLPGGEIPVHPAPLYESAGCVALFLFMRRLPRRLWPGVVLAGLGLIRLAVTPWRAPDPLADPVVPAPWLAAAWVAVGVHRLLRTRGGFRRSARARLGLRGVGDDRA